MDVVERNFWRNFFYFNSKLFCFGPTQPVNLNSLRFVLFFSFNFLSIPFGWSNFIKIIFYTILIMWIICKKNVNLKQEIFWPFLIISQIKSKNHRIKFFLNSLFQVLSYKLCLPLWYFCAKICTNIQFTSILFIAFYHLIS